MYAGHNCTNYVAYVESVVDHAPSPAYDLGSADTWASEAAAHDVAVNQSPAVGSVAQWDAAASNDDNGHVAYVEAVNTRNGSVTSVTVSEDAYPDGPFEWRDILAGSSSWSDNFIHFKDLPSVPGSYPDGTFIKGDTSNTVYVMAGGAPMGITTWNYWGGSEPVNVIPQANMNALLQQHPYPADGTFIKKGGTSAILEVIGGSYLDVSSWAAWGKSQPVTTVDPWAIANQLLPSPRDGTFIKVGTTKAVMEVVGDAALDVSSWAPFGGAQPTTTVDHWAVQHDLLKYPKDGTFIKAGGTNSILEVAGGSPLPVSSWANVGGAYPYAIVDPWAISNDLRQFPLDGTFLKNATGNGVYVVAGGAALDVSSWTAIGGPHSVVNVDQWAIDHYLLSYPADGTLIEGYESGHEYLIQDHAAVYQTPSTGSPTIVDDWAIINQLGVSDG